MNNGLAVIPAKDAHALRGATWAMVAEYLPTAFSFRIQPCQPFLIASKRI